MADENIDPTKIPFNTLNDVSQPIGGRRERMDSGTEFMDALANAASHQFVSDSLQNTGPYKAIVLRVETDKQSAEAGSWLANTFASFFGDPPQIVKIKARIPEIHAALPVPDQVGSANGPHQPIIDLYPTFIAQDTQIEEPKPGDIVNVDFGNKNTYSDPIYLGPLLKTTGGPGAAGAASGAGMFGNCGASTPIPPVPAPQPTPQEATMPTTGTIDPSTGLPTYALDPNSPTTEEESPIEESTELVIARPPEFIFGMEGQSLGMSDPDSQFGTGAQTEESAATPFGSVYVFGDSNTQGQQDPMVDYFSGFPFFFNAWYGGAYRMGYTDTPEDLVKGKNLGKAIDSYDYKYGDTVIIGSIGGNKSFGARKKYPSIYAGSGAGIAQYINATITGSLSQPPGTTPDSTWPEEAKRYGLEKLLSDQEENSTGEQFIKFCATLLSLKHKGINIIIFGLPYGGKESRQEDREWFDTVQFASFAAYGLGKNYVSTMEQSKLLKAGENDVHYFPGNGGAGYQAYFDTLLRPYIDSYYQIYEGITTDAIPLDIALGLEESQQNVSLPEGENASEKAQEALEKFLEEVQNSKPEPPPTPTSPAVPSQACIGPVGGVTGGGTGGGGAFTGGGGGVGKAVNYPLEPFNGGKADVIVFNGVEYPFPGGGIRGDAQFKTYKRKVDPSYVVIHNSVTSTYESCVHVLRTKKNKDKESKNYGKPIGLGVHFTIDYDGYIYQHADPMISITSHGPDLNSKSVGIETITMYYWKPENKHHQEHQLGQGFTESEPHWWMGKMKNYGKIYNFARPPEHMIQSANRLIDALFQHMPSLALQYPSKETKYGKLKGDPGGGLVSHRDYVAKIDGRYFMSRYIEHRTGEKILDFH